MQEPEGGYTVNVPALPGSVTYGESVDHAMSMAQEVIELYAAALIAEADPVSDDDRPLEHSPVDPDHSSDPF